MKKILVILLYFFITLNIYNFSYADNSSQTKTNTEIKNNELTSFEQNLKGLLDDIIQKQIDKYGVYGGYEKIYDFNNKIKKLKENNKIKSLKRVMKISMDNYEQKYFIHDNIIYVKNLDNSYTYFDGNKINIYITNDNVKTYKYKICEIKNKEKCVDYDNTLFKTQLYRNDLNIKEYNENIFYNKNGIYKRSVKSYYPDSNDFMLGRSKLGFNLTELNYNNKTYYFGGNYDNVNNLGGYKIDNILYLGIFDVKKVSDLNIYNYTKINKQALLDTIELDLRYNEYISKAEIDNIYKESLNLSDEKSIYEFVKDKLKYDMDVYNMYLETGKVEDSKNYVFTGVGANNTNLAVCSGYAGLLEYLFAFKDYKSISKQEGYYIDLQNGNLIPHAWLKQGNKYFDVTFDDGLGNSQDTNDLYYALPYDIIMVDRILDSEKDRYNKILSMTNNQRKEYVFSRYLELAKNKKYDNIQLLNPYRVLSKYIDGNIATMTLNGLWDKVKNRYIFDLNNEGSISSFKNYNTNEELGIKNVELIRVKNIEELMQVLQSYNIQKIELGVDNNGKFYILQNIKY